MLEIINKILWAIATIFILSSGIYFSFKLKFPQFKIIKMIKSLKSEHKEGISPFKSLMLVLAGRIGVGSIAGVAIAIYVGGIGSIFWMWIIALITSPNSFLETCLGIIYKEKDETDIYKGGPSYYIEKGLNKRYLGIIYAIIVIFSYVIGFISIQSNTITKSLNQLIEINPIYVGVFITVLTLIIIYGGIKRISDATSKLVPIMTVFYLIISFYIILININKVPSILFSIIKQAFNLKPFLSGFLVSFIIGIQRGIFSNEAGLGTGAIASSTVNTEKYQKEGYVQTLGIYITTLLICTSTALVILLSNYDTLVLENINGIEITQYAYFYHLSKFGNIFVFISIVLFSFSTILTGYYYGESSLKFIFKNKAPINLLKISTLLFVFLGTILESKLLWDIVDMFVAVLAIINIYALFKLKDKVKIK